MSLALTYHEATKYAPETIGGHPGIDWEAQPSAFKEYEGGSAIDLSRFLPFDPNPFTGEPAEADAHLPAKGRSLAALARLIYAAYGVTGLLRGSRPTFLRSAPSAGGLYPAELYLVVRDWPGVPPGLYGYHPRLHALIPLWEGVEVADHLGAACYGNAEVAAAPLALVITGVFERSRWRYRERAYRRICLDTGHLLGNALLAAHDLGLRAHLTTAFHDDAVDALLRLDQDQEGALAVVALDLPGEARRPRWTALPSGTGSADAAPLLDTLHAASRLPAQRPRPAPHGDGQEADLHLRHGWSAAVALKPGPTPLAEEVLHTIAGRRSTRAFVPDAITAEALGRILAAGVGHPAAGLGPAPALASGYLRTFVVIHSVMGIEPGVYYLAPHGLELRRVRAEVPREATQELCLGQELGGAAAAVVVHTADLEAAVRHGGDRIYRLLHLDAGLIGERLDLSALAEGLGASGIGGFYDDRTTDLIGIPRSHAVLYLTTIGVPG